MISAPGTLVPASSTTKRTASECEAAIGRHRTAPSLCPTSPIAGGIDVGVFGQTGDPGQGVPCEVGGRGLRDVPRGAADPPVVVAQDRDPAAREMVGDDPEEGEADQFLVTVLRSRPRKHDHTREGARALGQGQRALQVGLAVLERDLLLAVRDGLLGLGLHRLRAFDGERPDGDSLREIALDSVPVERPIPDGESDRGLKFEVHATFRV